MRDWIANLWSGLAGRRSLIWPSRRHSGIPPEATQNAPVADQVHTTRHPSAAEASVAEVPNILVPPHPDDLPVAILEFDGPPGPVPIRRGATVIGRHSDDDIRIRDVRISRHHARLIADAEHCEILNLTASRPEPNPMLVNGADRERAEVIDGDVVTLGGVSFTFRKAHG